MKNTAFALLALLAAACGAPTEADTDSAEDTVSAEDALSTSSNAYVTLRRDYRRCISPLCGGYWAKDVNKRTAEVYVSGLDFSKSGLDAATQDRVRGAESLLVRGKLGRQESRFKTRPLIVIEAYAGLPGQTVATGDAFYSVRDVRALIRCAKAPCNGLTAKKLATTSSTSFYAYSLAPALGTLVDEQWINWNIGAKQWIVAGHFEQGQKVDTTYEKLLETSQIYIRLPEAPGPCAQQPQARCQRGFVTAWTRDNNRCLLNQGCVEQKFCTLQVPQCDDGYTLQAWAGENGGCTTYACDPTFSVPEQP